MTTPRSPLLPASLKSLRLPILLLAGSMTTMVGSAIAPVLPEMKQALQLDAALSANLVSAHCLTIALFSPPLGVLADRIGRLQVLVLSLVGYAIVGVAGAFMHDITSLLISRGLIGIASGGIAAASLGLLSSLYEGEARTKALGYATSALTLTGIVYPLLAGVLGSGRWQNAFYLYALALPLAGLAAIALQPESNGRSPGQSTEPTLKSSPRLKQALTQAPVVWLMLLMALASIAMYAVVAYGPSYFKATIGVNTLINGIVLALRALGAAVVSAVGTGWLLKRLGRRWAIGLGFGLMTLTLAAIPLITNLTWILTTAFVFGAGFGIVLPNLYGRLADFAPPDLRSSVLAAGTGAGFLGQFLSPVLLAPVLNRFGLPAVFFAAAGVAAIGGVLLLIVEKEPRE